MTTVTAGAVRPAGLPTALTPGGAQAVFRAVLDVLARPGTVKRLPSAAVEPLAAHVPPALLPLLALADLSTRACVIGEETGAGADRRTVWNEIVRVATNAPRAALGDARLVAALRPLSAEELGSLCTGTAAAPENGALACLAVSRIAIGPDAKAEADGQDTDNAPGRVDQHGDDARLLRLSGPGVSGTRAVAVAGLCAGFTAARQALVAGFPAGADLLLITPDGAMTGLSRTTIVNEETF